MKIEPLFDRVVLSAIKEPVEKSSGLVLPETSQERPLMAKVLAVGDGTSTDGKQVEMRVKVGDIVLYSKYAGSNFKFENKEVVLIRQCDILARIHE